MSSAPDFWLGRLSAATDYRQLQAVFSEIVQFARQEGDAAELARAIDEAIHRLVEERVRDEDELKDVQARYDEFRHEQRGVVGWFKRHLPFTETRRAELGHRDAISEQQAEILADNLVIARAQMVKEEFLTPEHRRLGYRLAEWQQRFEDCDSQAQMRECVAALRELTTEVIESQAFLSELDRDIEAFAGARFPEELDQQQQREDLSAAQDELATLQREVDAETSLRRTICRQIGQHVLEQLLGSDANFRTDHGRISALSSARAALKQAQEAAGSLQQRAKQLDTLAAEMDSLPSEIEKLKRECEKLQRKLNGAQVEHRRLADAFEPYQREFTTAEREAQQAQSALAAVKKVYDAWQREQQSQGGTLGETSAVEWEYQEAQENAQSAAAALDAARRPYDSARRDVQKAEQELKSLDSQLEKEQAKLAALRRKLPDLQGRYDLERDRTLRELDEARPVLQSYFDAADSAGHASQLHDQGSPKDVLQPLFAGRYELRGWEHTLHAPVNARDVHDGKRMLEAAQRAIEAETSDLDSSLTELDKRCLTVWRSHCEELSGEDLADDICAEKPWD